MTVNIRSALNGWVLSAPVEDPHQSKVYKKSSVWANVLELKTIKLDFTKLLEWMNYVKYDHNKQDRLIGTILEKFSPTTGDP